MIGRQAYECIHCGLLFAGRMRKDGSGVIYAYDRAPTTDAPTQPAVCSSCLEAVNQAQAVTLAMQPFPEMKKADPR